MKRLLIASTRLPPISGGSEQVAWETANRLAGEYEVHIITIGRGITNTSDKIRIHYLPPIQPFTLLYSTILRGRINSVLANVSPDIVHSHTALPWPYIFAGLKCGKVVTCHGLSFSDSSEYPHMRLRHPNRFLIKRGYQSANVLISPSKWLAEWLDERFHTSCKILPNGVNTSKFSPRETADADSKTILYVGRFLPRKGIREIVEAAKVLQDYEFLLVGDQRTATVKVPPMRNVRVVGFVDDIVACYNQAAICIFPSHWENFPMVGLEAMACGRPIIATRLGFSEYVEDGVDGLLIDARRCDKLIEAITYLMGDYDARKKIGQKARLKAEQYDWSITMNRYRTLYENLTK